MEPGAGFLGLCQPASTGSTLDASAGLAAGEEPAAAALADVFWSVDDFGELVAFAVVVVVNFGAVVPVSMSMLMARACLNCSS